MSKMADLSYEIEQLYIDGVTYPPKIAQLLNCPLGLVYDWLESCSVEAGPEMIEG